MNPLNELVTQAFGGVQREFADTGEVSAKYLAFSGTTKCLFIPPMVEDKDVNAVLMQALFAIEKIDRYVFIDEAWIVKSDTPTDIPSSDHPDRVEIVLFLAEDHSSTLLGQSVIHRPPGQPPHLGPLTFLKTDQLEGRIVGLLRPPGSTMQ